MPCNSKVKSKEEPHGGSRKGGMSDCPHVKSVGAHAEPEPETAESTRL